MCLIHRAHWIDASCVGRPVRTMEADNARDSGALPRGAAASTVDDLDEKIRMHELELEEWVASSSSSGPGERDEGRATAGILGTSAALVALYNQRAMALVDDMDFPGAHAILQKTLRLTAGADDPGGPGPLSASSGGGRGGSVRVRVAEGDRLRMRATSLNNLGCLYKRQGRLRRALVSLEAAASIEKDLSSAESPAGTHLKDRKSVV